MLLRLLPFLPLLVLLGSCTPEEPAPERPNIILILADDHAAQAISAYGSRINNTPNIDRLAQKGMRFNNMFVTNSICAPSRATILTGTFNHLNGVIDNRLTFDSSQVTFPKLLRQAGYQTVAVGKWHLKSRPTGFDYTNVLPGQGSYYNPVFLENGERREYEGYVTDLTTDFAIQWLDSADTEQPFFLWLGQKAPHRNWMPGPDHLTMYDDIEIPEPATLFDDYSGRSAAAREQELSIAEDMLLAWDLKLTEVAIPGGPTGADNQMYNILTTMTEDQREAWLAAYGPKNEVFMEAGLDGEELTRWKYQRYIKDYLRSVASVDDNVGRLLDYLEERGLTENTIIIYSSDQGFYLGEHGWFDKRFMYEESYRMPFLIQYPGAIPAGSETDALAMNIDFAPTFLDYAGVNIPGDMQGRSLRPILENGETPDDWRNATYYHYYEYPAVHMVKRHYGVRTDRYKLIHFYYDIDAWELFDLEEDPNELNSVYEDPAYAEIRDSLTDLLQALQEQYGDDPALFTQNLELKKADHLARGAAVRFSTPPADRYDADAETKLTDGSYWVYSMYAPIRGDDWLGWRGQPVEFVIDLGREQAVNKVRLNLYQSPNSWAYFPETINCAVSGDGQNFEQIGGTTTMNNEFLDGTEFYEVSFPQRSARYVRLQLRPMEYIPSHLPGGGNDPWIFVDEVMVE